MANTPDPQRCQWCGQAEGHRPGCRNTPDPQPLDLRAIHDRRVESLIRNDVGTLSDLIETLIVEVERLRAEVDDLAAVLTGMDEPAPFDCVDGEHSYRWEKTQYVCKSCGDTAALDDPRWD